MAPVLKARRDAAFEQAVRLLRQAPDAAPPIPTPDPSQIKTPPENAFTQRIQWLAERIPQGSRLLDLGCGRGEILYFLHHHRQVDYLGLEREPEHLAACHRIGVPAIAADFNQLDDPAMRFACSQRWDTVLIIDSLVYWRCPALVLAALQDRCQRIFVTVNNAGHFRYRWRSLCGQDDTLPNARRSSIKGPLEFSTQWFNHRWTVRGFQTWGEALDYNVKPMARRSIGAEYLPLGPLPGCLCKSVLYELTPAR
jgi:methionine biosynthesis protein MetW